MEPAYPLESARISARRFIRTGWLWAGILILAGILTAIGWRPVGAAIFEQRAGRIVTQIMDESSSSSGGFACLAAPLTDAAEQQKARQAAIYLERAVEFAPQRAHLQYRLGQEYCRSGDYPRAVAAFEKYHLLRPDNPQASLELGFALEKLCPPAGVCAGGRSAVRAWEDGGVQPHQFIENGEQARRREDYLKAIEWYQRAQMMGVDLRSTIAYGQYLYYKNAGNLDEASQALIKAVEIDAGWLNGTIRYRSWYELGKELFTKEEFDRAEPLLRKAIEIVPDETLEKNTLSEAYRFSGGIHWRQNKLALAIDDFYQAVRINPQSIWANIHYGKFLYLYDSDKINIAAHYIEAGILLAGDQPATWNNIIDFWFENNEIDQIDRICRLAEKITMLERCNN